MRGQWVAAISDGPGKTKYISITNIGDEVLTLHQDQRIGIWLAGDHEPGLLGFSSIGSRRHMEWQNLTLETTTDARSEDMEIEAGGRATRVQNSAHDTPEVKADVDQVSEGRDQPDASDLDFTWDSDQDYDECVYYHEASDLSVEDVDRQMAVLPEVPVTTEDVKIEDIQLCGSDNQTPEEIDLLLQRIWKF
ncbi:hypothetical protein PHMEG_0007808 [Phytophthora megakarya]|uniref:Uncharacterized protein n=1 Tax=Phytophthora megakarya TaxID=4795 RepID=A0A225WK92_9STRA|nr:hypothetical protein PHMEG_0007808 [Phytophthora megakarya]